MTKKGESIKGQKEMSPRMSVQPSCEHDYCNQGERIAVLEDRDRILFGNGQPGILQRMDEKMDDMNNKLERVIYFLIALSASGGGVVGWFLNNIL